MENLVEINESTRKSLKYSDGQITRIGVTGLRGIPDIMGGIETHCKELLPRTKCARPNHMFVVLGRKPYMKNRHYIYKGIEVVGIFTIKNKYIETVLHTFISILYARYVFKCSIIHIHGIGPGLMAPIAWILGLKVIITHHGEDYNRQKWNSFAKLLLKFGEMSSVRYSRILIVVSKHVSRTLKDRYTKSSERIYYIPNGATTISTRATDDQARDTLKAFGLQQKKYILAVGRLVPEKNFDILIEAFIKSKIEGTLVIVGSADHKDAYSKTLLNKANNRIKFIGFQKHETLSVLYANASLFVLPSSHEGLPIAALEAAASGCPMVLSDIPANLEIGLPPNNYSRVGDSDQLAEKLRRPLSEFAIDTEAVTLRYEWAAIAQSTSDLYEALASAR